MGEITIKQIHVLIYSILLITTQIALAERPSQILEGSYQNDLVSDRSNSDNNESQSSEQYEKENSYRTLRSIGPSWKRPDIKSNYLDLNNIRFTNRARCAEDSKLPAKQANILIDSMNVAKSAYRLALATGEEPKSFTKRAVSRFRYANYLLLNYISGKILNGQLPLLPAENTDEYFSKRYVSPEHNANQGNNDYRNHILDNYSQISESCKQDEYCEELDLYVSKIWKNKDYKFGKRTKESWKKIDNFSSKHFIERKSILDDKKYPYKMACHFLKEFSPFMAQTSTVKPNKKVLEAIALTQVEQEKYIAACDNVEAQSTLETVAYQLDLLNIDTSDFNKVGFDYWNSLKLYYSWAWRNADELDGFSFPFHQLFKSVNLEQSVMLFPTGCKSITIPKCEANFLNKNQIRNFAKSTFEREALNLDLMKEVPEGAQQELLDDPFTDYNNDILQYGKFPDMNEWATKFAKNLRRGRSHMTKKLNSAISFLKVAENKLSTETIIANLDKITNKRSTWSRNSDSVISIDEMKNELYYMCSEYNVAAHETLSFIKADMNYLKDLKGLDNVFKNLTTKELKNYYYYFEKTSKEVLSFCQSLEDKDIWDGFSPNPDGYKQWFKEVMHKGDLNAQPQNEMTLNIVGTPLLKYKGLTTPDNVICYNGVDCSRQLLESIVGVYSVSKYLKTFYVDFQKVNSPSLVNPYAERTACKIYDPWWKVKKTLFNTFHDLTTAAVSLVNPTPFYLTVDYIPQRAISFNQLMENGEVKFDQNMSNQKWVGQFGARLDGLLGIPCDISVSNYAGDLPSRKMFLSGFTFKGCIQNKNGGEITVQAADDITLDQLKVLQGCASCSINFEGLSGWVSNFKSLPVVSSGYYLIRGIMKFYKGITDPIEIPRRWEVNVNNVLETYRRYGTIPKKCVKPLSKGDFCMPSKCEYAVAKAAQEEFNTTLTYMDENRDSADIKLVHCKNKIKVMDTKVMGMFCRGKIEAANFWEDDSCSFPEKRLR